MTQIHHQIDDLGPLYSWNTLHDLQAVPLKGPPAIITAYIAFGKNL